MVGVGLLSAVVTLGGAGIGFLVYKVGTLQTKVNQLDSGVRIIADQTELGFQSVVDDMHQNLQQMAVIISNIMPDDYDGGDNTGGVS